MGNDKVNLPDFKMEDVSILAWVFNNNIKSEKGEPLDFRDRLFLLDILTDWTPNIAWKKCSQVGGSVVFNLKCFFGLIKRGWNIIYTMPTDGDVEEFVKTKTNALIRENPALFVGLDSESVYLKQIAKRNLYFKGTISKSAAISTSSDLNVHDEISRSDQPTVKTYESRTKASTYKGKWSFSNPTTEKDALDEQWRSSDQKEWYITCGGCGMLQQLVWPQSIDPTRKCYQCVGCKKALTREERRVGKWIDRDGVVWTGKINPVYTISGWHTSHLMAPWISAEEILRDSEGDQEYFYNFVLGEPYNPGDLSVNRGTILDNWTQRDLSVGKFWYLGVDVGNIKHYVLGTELGVVRVGKFTKWQDLDDMMDMYNPALVIDANPDNTMARYYVEKYNGAYMSVFKENTDNPQVIVWWGDTTGKLDAPGNRKGIVYSNRNRVIDQLIDHILRAGMLFGLPSDQAMREYLAHWATLRRVKVVNTRGIESYEWQSTTGVDHYVFATLYYYLARLGAGMGAVIQQESKKEPVPHDNVGASIGETLMDNNPMQWAQH